MNDKMINLLIKNGYEVLKKAKPLIVDGINTTLYRISKGGTYLFITDIEIDGEINLYKGHSCIGYIDPGCWENGVSNNDLYSA